MTAPVRGALWLVVVAALAWSGAQIVGAVGKMDPDSRYYLSSAALLVVAVLAILVVFTAVQGTVVRLLHRLVSARLRNRWSLFVAWSLLRSHRYEVPKRHRLARWLAAACPARTRAGAAACLLLAAAAGTGAMLRGPWSALWALSPLGERWTALAVSTGAIALAATSLCAWWAASQPEDRLSTPQLRGAVTLPNFISMVGVGVGVWALIVVLSVMSGFETDLKAKILATNAHALLLPLDDAEALAEPLAALERLRASPGVVSADAYSEQEASISSPFNTSVNLTLRGISPDGTLARRLGESVVAGHLSLLARPELFGDEPLAVALEAPSPAVAPSAPAAPDSGGIRMPAIPGGLVPASEAASKPLAAPPLPPLRSLRPTIALGVELAEGLRVSVGDEVRVIAMEAGVGPLGVRPRAQPFVVAAIFHTGMYEFDLKLAYAHAPEVQRLFNAGDELNRIEVRVAEPFAIEFALPALQTAAGTSGQLLTWQVLNRSLFSALKLEKLAMFFVLACIIVVAGLNILGSIFMLVSDKSKEIAVLRAMGASESGVFAAFLSIGALLGVLGAGTGAALGLITCGLLWAVGLPLPKEYYIATLPVQVHGADVWSAALAAVAIAVLAPLWPARVAARVSPSQGLRDE